MDNNNNKAIVQVTNYLDKSWQNIKQKLQNGL